ncbi:DUF6461 domain-containing protein [Streptomyces sp. NPDC001226]
MRGRGRGSRAAATGWTRGSCPKSRGGAEAVALHYNEKPMHWFKYAVNGDIIVDFHTLQPIEPTGLDPQRLDAFMRPLGLIPGRSDPLHSVLALAENAFGLRVTTAGDDDERWSGSLLPLPE